MRVLVGGVGYRNLCDHSFGVVLTDALATCEWPANVSVEDVSYNPIAVVQRLQDDPVDRRFDMTMFVGAVHRPGRTTGSFSIYRWDKVLPSPDEIHGAITDAVTGVIALDNTLVIARYFGVLPENVVVIEVEPLLHAFGDTLTAPVQAAFAAVCGAVTRLALNPESAEALPTGSLRSDRPTYSGFMSARVSDVTSRLN